MCGISGFIDFSRGQSAEALSDLAGKMADAVRHRGPDDSGVWCDPRFGVAFGHRRLSIIDVSSHGHQPMESECGRYVITYNGEIYNFPGLRQELEQLGHGFRGHSDTEVLMAAFSQWGFDAALPRLNGMFAFALWDRQEATLHLARDPLGEKPLYHGWMGQVFLFGSELKSLMTHPACRRRIDRGALAQFFRHNYIPSPRSIFEGLQKLPPGTKATLAASAAPGAQLQPQAYWDAGQAAEAGLAGPWKGSDAEAVEQLDGLLSEAVGLRMVSDVPLGAFLSGGIDSSTVVALMQAQSSRPVRTFTIGFHEEGYNEAVHAKAVAAHLGTDHTELYVTPEQAREVIPRLAALYDEPFADSSQIPTLLVSQMARGHVTVSLSGDGGDELFGGYSRYLLGARLWKYLGWVPRPLARLSAAMLAAMPAPVWKMAFGVSGRVIPRLRNISRPAEKVKKLAEMLGASNSSDFYRLLVSHWTRPADLVLGASEPDSVLSNVPGFPIGKIAAAIPDFMHRSMLLDTVSYLPDDILVKVDRASMSVSLESRIPLLDTRVVEFAWRVPLAMKFRNGQGKWLLRQVLSRYVPPELTERPKMGFGVPIGQWLRGPLREWGESLLDESRLRREGFLHPAPIRKKWEQHQAGLANWEYPLWDVLMFQAWQEAYQGT